MRLRRSAALVVALTSLGLAAPHASADTVLDRLRRLIADTQVCVGTPPTVAATQLCTGDVLNDLGPVEPPVVCVDAPAAVAKGICTDVIDPPEPAYQEYVVVLRPPRPLDPRAMSLAGAVEYLSAEASATPDIAASRAQQAGAQVEFVYRNALRGFAAVMSPSTYATVAADPAVKYIRPVAWGTVAVDQPSPTWGLDRIDQRNLPLDTNYHYNATGAGVTAYVVDTGINYAHVDFDGRAVLGTDASDPLGDGDDCYGHGTHVAGTIGGATYGVAKNVTLVSVRVLDCGGWGTTAQYAAGLDWMVQTHQAGVPAVANVSLHYFTVDPVVDDATNAAIADGIAFSVAAANDSADACLDSPSNVPDAMTIGATDQTDQRAWFSNWGNCVDWFAPGVDVESAYIGSPTATATFSGTSMASPHTAGVAAQLLQSDPTLTPAQVRDAIYAMTTKNIVTDAQSPNAHLLYTEVLVHLAAVGTIEVSRDGSGYHWDTTGAYETDFACALYTVGTVRVECTPLPSNTVVWECKHFLLDAWAPAPTAPTSTGNVKGTVKCDKPPVLATADVVGTGHAFADSAVPVIDMGTAGLVVCRAAGIGTTALPTGSYRVLCNEPGVAKPFGPGYQRS